MRASALELEVILAAMAERFSAGDMHRLAGLGGRGACSHNLGLRIYVWVTASAYWCVW